MASTKQILLYCFLVFNVTLVLMNVPAWQDFWNQGNKMAVVSLTLLNTTTDSPNLRGGSNNGFLSPKTKAPEIPEEPASPLPPTPAAAPVHPFDQLSKKLEQLNWDPERIEEVVRKYWNNERKLVEYRVNKKTNNKTAVLSTSCLQTAAWIVVGLLEKQIRPDNLHVGLYKIPKEKDLIVYDNTKNRSALAAPVIDSIRSFVDSRPSNESILLQFDMYQVLNPPTRFYIDHHFALHIFDGQVSLYQGWQDMFNLIDWMKNPAMHKLRYPMPIDTFLGHFEKFLTYTEEPTESKERLKAIWEIFGMTETLVYHEKKGSEDENVRALRYPWVVSLITHWPNPQESQLNELSVGF